MELREYQNRIVNEIYSNWQLNYRNVLVQLATGAGKTIIFSKIMADYQEHAIAIAHRMELVGQISLALARFGIYHNIVAQKGTIREIVRLHIMELGKSYLNPNSNKFVAGIDTLVRMDTETPWFKKIGLVVQDEGHHVLRENKWGIAANLFPNAFGLYPTATPIRADGKGLGRHADGLMDSLIVGVSMRQLIKMGYLTDYRIFAPPSDLDLTQVTLSASGDYSPPKLRNAVHKSHITGDVVSHYLKIAPNKLGVTFAVDIEAATEIAVAFRKKGVAAEVISSKTPELLRSQIMRKFKDREILQIVNVDLLGEGVDVPAIEVVSMARPTQSYALYSQQFGRALRPMEGKTHAIIIDHVNNVIRHGLPDAPRAWSMDARNKRRTNGDLDIIPLRVCGNISCLGVYERYKLKCPYCGYYTPPTSRTTPEQVDGDLFELDAEVLSRMRGDIGIVDGAPKVPQYLDPVAQRAIINRHKNRQNAQKELRESIALWAAYLKQKDFSDQEIYKSFFLEFKIDILSAQVLNTNDTEKLEDRIKNHIDKMRNNI